MGLNLELKKAQSGKTVRASGHDICRLDSHFLFNTLSGLYSISLNGGDSGNQQDMPSMILKVSDYLRYILSSDNKEVTLNHELEFIQSYLELEKLRYGKSRALTTNLKGNDSFIYFPKTLLYTVCIKCVAFGPSRMEVPNSIEISGRVQGQLLNCEFEFSVPEQFVEEDLDVFLEELARSIDSYPIQNYSLTPLLRLSESKLMLKLQVQP